MTTKPGIKKLRKIWEETERRVVAIDPGDKYIGIAAVGVSRIGTSSPSRSFVENVLIRKPWMNKEVWVIEDFVLYPRSAEAFYYKTFPTSEFIGMLEITAKRLGIPTVRQRASTVKNFVTNERLEEWDLAHIPRNEHERDALRHLIYYLISTTAMKDGLGNSLGIG